jgi:hypothetical protein
MFLARQHARTPILYAFSYCGRVCLSGKTNIVFPSGGASEPHRLKYIIVGSRISVASSFLASYSIIFFVWVRLWTAFSVFFISVAPRLFGCIWLSVSVAG